MNLQEYINKNGLQREDLLARIAASLELDQTRSKRMETSYYAIYEELIKDELFFSKVDILVYPQGSKAIGTTVKPLGKDEFDLDIAIQINDYYHNYTSSEIYNHLIRVFQNSSVYNPKLEKKNRCARINYSGDFHMDILPGCIIINDSSQLMVPDRQLKDWTSSNPKGYAEWFNEKSKKVKYSVLRKAYENYNLILDAKSEQEELPEEDYKNKLPLKRAVQLTKRYRDIYFQNKPKFRTSSIIITTIFGELYEGEPSIYETIDSIVTKIANRYAGYQYLFESQGIKQRIKVLNPVNPSEDFTEKWDDNEEYYKQFIAFIKSFKNSWEKLKETDFGIAEELFGSNRTKKVLVEQLSILPKTSRYNMEKSGVTIFGGNTYVDRKGNVNETQGYKSKKNRNFGDKV